MMKNTSFLLLISMLLGGCATGLQVQVNAIADSSIKPASTRFVLVNGNSEGKEDELFFREFSSYFIPLLADKGYQKVDSASNADIEVIFRYTVSDGRSGVHTFSHPIYEAFVGETITFTETKTDPSGTITTTKGSVHLPPRYQYVGTTIESRSFTIFTCSAVLEARLVTAGSDSESPRVLWKTMISSTSDLDDLRAVMPVMAAAAAPYMTGNSGMQKSIVLKQDDPKVLAIRKAANSR